MSFAEFKTYIETRYADEHTEAGNSLRLVLAQWAATGDVLHEGWVQARVEHVERPLSLPAPAPRSCSPILLLYRPPTLKARSLLHHGNDFFCQLRAATGESAHMVRTALR